MVGVKWPVLVSGYYTYANDITYLHLINIGSIGAYCICMKIKTIETHSVIQFIQSRSFKEINKELNNVNELELISNSTIDMVSGMLQRELLNKVDWNAVAKAFVMNYWLNK